MAERINEEVFQEKVLKNYGAVLVEFYSDSCVACKRLSPVLADAEERYADQVAVYKVNTNYESGLAERFEITANPTLVIFRRGIEQERRTGFLPPKELFPWIERFLG